MSSDPQMYDASNKAYLRTDFVNVLASIVACLLVAGAVALTLFG